MPLAAGRKKLRVLLIEDSEMDARLVLHELRLANFDVTSARVETADAMRAKLHDDAWDIILCDCSLPAFDVFGALAVLAATGVDTPLIIVSGFFDEAEASRALAAGARDFLVKGDPGRLASVIERELRETRSRATLP